MKECYFSYRQETVKCQLAPENSCVSIQSVGIPDGVLENMKTALAGYTVEALVIMRNHHLPDAYFGKVCKASPAIVETLNSMIEEKSKTVPPEVPQ